MAVRNENVFTNLGRAFKKELELVVQQVLAKNGVKRNSDLAQSVEFSDNSRDSLFMYVNDYYQYVSEGRRQRTKKVPLYALIQFIKKNNIATEGRTINQIAFAMQNAIYKNGIRGKNFIQHVENTVLDTVEIRCADFLEEVIADSLYAAFTVK